MLIRVGLLAVMTFLSLQAQGGRGGTLGVLGVSGPNSSGQGGQPIASDCAASGSVVNAVTGEAIPRASVNLGSANGVGTSSDAQGQWSVKNVTCGTHVATATRAGFIQPNLSALSAGAAQRVNLVSGTPATGVKIQLLPEASISGKVVNSDGDAVESAQIRIMRATVQAGKRMLTNMGGGATDSSGSFRVGRLVPGHYIVCVDSSVTTFPVGGGESLVYQESCYPGPPSAGPSIAMAIEAGRDVRTGFTLQTARGVHVRGSVSGIPPRVASAGGRGGPPVVIQLLDRVSGNGGRGGQVMEKDGQDGTFDISSVRPGSYLLTAQRRQVGNQPETAQQIRLDVAQMDLEVGSSDVNGITLTLQPPGSVSGTVHYQLTPSSTPGLPPQLNVNLGPWQTSGPVFMPAPVPQAAWDADRMNFELAGVGAGEYRLSANMGGRGPGTSFAYIKSATLRGVDVLNQPLRVDGPMGPIEIVVSDAVGEVNATVNDADGKPAMGTVLLLGDNDQRIMVPADDHGAATRKNVPVGNYTAWAFEDVNSTPYAEDDWMRQNAGPGEKIAVTSAGSVSVALKRISAPGQ